MANTTNMNVLEDAYPFKPSVTESHRRKVNQVFACFQLSPALNAQLDQIVSANKENSGKYRRAPENRIQFKKNLFTLINFINTVKNEPDQLMALQLRIGLIDLGENIAVHAACLKDVMSLSHSSVNSYLVNVGSIELPRDKRIALLHKTFLGKYQFLIRQWTVRTKPPGEDEMLPIMQPSHYRSRANHKAVVPPQPVHPHVLPQIMTEDKQLAFRPKENPQDLPQIIRLSDNFKPKEGVPSNDLIILPHQADPPDIKPAPLFKMNHSSLTCVSEPHAAQQLFTNTLGAPCFH